MGNNLCWGFLDFYLYIMIIFWILCLILFGLGKINQELNKMTVLLKGDKATPNLYGTHKSIEFFIGCQYRHLFRKFFATVIFKPCAMTELSSSCTSPDALEFIISTQNGKCPLHLPICRVLPRAYPWSCLHAG